MFKLVLEKAEATRLLSPCNSPGKNTMEWLPFPSPRDLPNPGMEPGSPALQADPLPSEPPGSPCITITTIYSQNFIIPTDTCYSLNNLLSLSRAEGFCFRVQWMCLLQVTFISGIIFYFSICARLASLSMFSRGICVVAYIKYATYFLFTAEYYSCAV